MMVLCVSAISINGLKKQLMPTLNLAKGEIVFHVDGSGATQRVVRHIGGTSWPGILTSEYPLSATV
jgi:hypothetical protein